MEKKLYISPINPFSPEHEKVLNEILKGVSKNEEIAKKLKKSESTVRNQICGNNAVGGRYSTKLNLSGFGIFGIIEKITGKRPGDKNEMIQILLDDVVFVK